LRKTSILGSAFALVLSSQLVSAQSYDVAAVGTITLQTVQKGTTELVAGKSTIVRCGMSSTGTLGPGEKIDGLMRVFVNGVEASYSPIYSDNGPLVPPPLSSQLNLDDSLNFYFVPPASANVELKVELNPAGPNQVPETDFTNNTATSGILSFNCKATPEVIFVPVDYRPGGGPTPKLPDPNLIKPGVGDNFIQGIYPGSDWEYRPYDFPSKLWTSSLSGSGSALNSSLIAEMQLMNPKPDFMYGWIPGSLPYNGQASGIPGSSAIGNTQPIRHQRTFAHELGHLFGLSHNTQNIGTVGVDVEHHLAITEALPEIKDGTKKDIMAAGLLTKQAWVWPTNYNFFLNHNKYQCAPVAKAAAPTASMFFGGVYDPAVGSLSLNHSLTLGGLRPEPSVDLTQADLQLVAFDAQGHELARVGVAAHTESCSGDARDLASPAVPFAASLPGSLDPTSVATVSILDATGRLLEQLGRSAHAPEVEFTSPRPSQLVPATLTLEWRATDADGDALTSYLRYSPDGESLLPLAMRVQGSSFTVDMAGMPRLVTGKGYFELVVSDGLNTSTARTALLRPTLQLATTAGVAPTTHVLTPDAGKIFPKAATVLLHASGWDLEDRGLTGSSVVWTSDLDGPISTGRMTSTAGLSLGNHTLTVTVTDSDGNTASDTTTITITDRPLPGTVVTCQTDLGFGGPGSSVLMVCGGDLSTGTTADVTLTGATPLQPLWLAVGTTNTPTPLFGGTVVPVPSSFLVPAVTDAAGDFSLLGFAGGGGPATLFVQAICIDPAQAFGFGISNAVQVDFLP
jgi:hypothetical protein